MLCTVALLLLSAGGTKKPADEEKDAAPVRNVEKSAGFLIRVPLPITDTVDKRVRGMIKRALGRLENEFGRPIIVLELDPGQSEFGAGSDFYRAMSLAKFLTSRELAGVKTVAYVPQTVKGHAVLVAMACEEIIMAPDAELGDAGVDIGDDEEIDPTVRAGYDQISRRRTIPREVALGMLDADLEVLKVETAVSVEYVFRKDLEEFEKRTTPKSVATLFPRGELGHFSGREGRELGFVKYLAPDRQAVARALELPEEAIREDPSLGGGWVPVELRLEGAVKPHVISRLNSMLESELRSGEVNLLILRIDSEGGSLKDSTQLANHLMSPNKMAAVRTVAYIPNQARADAALIAMACDEVIMHPKAVLGGTGDYAIPESEVEAGVKWVQTQLGPSKSRYWSLLAALIDPEMRVFRYQNVKSGREAYLSEKEHDVLDDADDWRKGKEITSAGVVLEATGQQAKELGLATEVVKNFDEMKQLYGLENDPRLIEPSWADTLVEALARPEFAVLLLVIGGVALYAELQLPGIGIGGFVATVCFLLFFWSKFLVQTATWLEVILFLGGFCCLLLEIFVLPGFGIFGLGGGLLILVSLILASQTFVFPSKQEEYAELRNSLIVVSAAGIGILGLGSIMRKYLPHTPLFRTVLLNPLEGEELDHLSARESVSDYSHLLGRSGVATTTLRPTGKAEFDNQLVDVITEGEILDRGTQVDVVEVRGNQIIVRAGDS